MCVLSNTCTARLAVGGLRPGAYRANDCPVTECTGPARHLAGTRCGHPSNCTGALVEQPIDHCRSAEAGTPVCWRHDASSHPQRETALRPHAPHRLLIEATGQKSARNCVPPQLLSASLFGTVDVRTRQNLAQHLCDHNLTWWTESWRASHTWNKKTCVGQSRVSGNNSRLVRETTFHKPLATLHFVFWP